MIHFLQNPFVDFKMIAVERRIKNIIFRNVTVYGMYFCGVRHLEHIKRDLSLRRLEVLTVILQCVSTKLSPR